MHRTLAQLIGFKSQSCKIWSSHLLVGVSCFFFAPAAAAFWAVWWCLLQYADLKDSYNMLQMILYFLLAVTYTMVVLTSYSADYLFIRRGQRSFYGRLDIFVASGTLFLSTFDFYLRASIIETMLLVLVPCCAFVYSTQSTAFEVWIWRHFYWHLVGGAVALYGSLRLLPAKNSIISELPLHLCITETVYAIGIAIFFVIRGTCPKELLDKFWQMGAQYANWQPVSGR
ncbi:unnamed protein product [Symbiodinium pilosum]|uniref:Uncharacterized protein n=1 Tax=Symbiodinium pilosum TaxID=2952 RepID=A0A812VTM1_SYMPI|nr:unnamed protein product [Symbiodinium pilosum]